MAHLAMQQPGPVHGFAGFLGRVAHGLPPVRKSSHADKARSSKSSAMERPAPASRWASMPLHGGLDQGRVTARSVEDAVSGVDKPGRRLVGLVGARDAAVPDGVDQAQRDEGKRVDGFGFKT
jgi:hypothetical protein